MLNRQKALLLMLGEATRPVQRVELMKWSFLLRHETTSGGGGAFYDFVPYQFGPFSFSLYQEVKRLMEQRYILAPSDNTWVANSDLCRSLMVHDLRLVIQARGIASRFGRMTSNQLLDYVYNRYPAFTVKSERMRLAERPRGAIAVHTAGYERTSVDKFLNLLVGSGIERLIDVRNNPVSRSYGFHKTTLSRLASKLDIEYLHVPELGISSQRRLAADGGDRVAMFDEYEATTLVDENAAVEDVCTLVRERPSVLVCREADPVCCHRSRLADSVAKRTGLSVAHLRG